MIPSSFTYKRAGSVAEALQLMSDSSDSKFLAGGHSLLPAMKIRLSDPEVLIDISKIDGLKGISEEGGNIVIGSLTTHGEIASSELIGKKLPIMAEGAGLIGDVQVRNRGTIGGSIAHADPAADWPAILIAVGASFEVQGGSGKREIPASEFFMGLFTTALQEGEIITSIKVPVPDSNTRSTYVKFMQPASRFAIVGCAVVVTVENGSCTKACIAIGGASVTPFRDNGVENALVGKAFNASTIGSAANLATNGVQLRSDHFASGEYRGQIAKVYTQRALESLI